MTEKNRKLLLGYNSSNLFVIAAEKEQVVFINTAAENHAKGKYLKRSVDIMLGEEIAEKARRAKDSLSFVTMQECLFFEFSCKLEIYPGDITVFIFTPHDGNVFDDIFPLEMTASFTETLRVPLTTLYQAMELTQSNMPAEVLGDEKTMRYFGAMEKSFFQLFHFFDNITSLIEVTNESLTFTPKNGDIVSFCASVTEKIQPVYELLGIPLTFESAEESVTFLFDPQKIERLILNLLSNSAKFTRPGNSVILKLTSFGNTAYISVTDKGSGIAPERLASVFYAYSDINRSSESGNRLGLSLVRSIAKLHGGNVALETKQNEGTTVTVSLSKALDSSLVLYQPIAEYELSGGFPPVLLDASNLLDSEAFSALRKRLKNSGNTTDKET